jgi:DNA-binding MarR family transcriptional regulator
VLVETVGYNLTKLCKLYFNYLNIVLSEFGLYEGQHNFMMLLWEHDGLAQSEICQRLQVEPASVSKGIERVENAGFIQRHPDPDDARANRIYLTERGRALEQPVKAALTKVEDQLLANMSTEERLLLRRLLMQMRTNLKQE